MVKATSFSTELVPLHDFWFDKSVILVSFFVLSKFTKFNKLLYSVFFVCCVRITLKAYASVFPNELFVLLFFSICLLLTHALQNQL